MFKIFLLPFYLSEHPIIFFLFLRQLPIQFTAHTFPVKMTPKMHFFYWKQAPKQVGIDPWYRGLPWFCWTNGGQIGTFLELWMRTNCANCFNENIQGRNAPKCFNIKCSQLQRLFLAYFWGQKLAKSQFHRSDIPELLMFQDKVLKSTL